MTCKTAFYNFKLNFDVETCTANLTINENKNIIDISGDFAIDNKNLIIVSEYLPKTYGFEYKVYENRLELTYMNETLVFTKK